MAICTKKMPVDMFSLSKPKANLNFSVVKPDIKFNLQMIERLKTTT